MSGGEGGLAQGWHVCGLPPKQLPSQPWLGRIGKGASQAGVSTTRPTARPAQPPPAPVHAAPNAPRAVPGQYLQAHEVGVLLQVALQAAHVHHDLHAVCSTHAVTVPKKYLSSQCGPPACIRGCGEQRGSGVARSCQACTAGLPLALQLPGPGRKLAGTGPGSHKQRKPAGATRIEHAARRQPAPTGQAVRPVPPGAPQRKRLGPRPAPARLSLLPAACRPPHPLRLDLLAQHSGRQQAAQVEAVALRLGECHALVILRAAGQGGAEQERLGQQAAGGCGVPPKAADGSMGHAVLAAGCEASAIVPRRAAPPPGPGGQRLARRNSLTVLRAYHHHTGLTSLRCRMSTPFMSVRTQGCRAQRGREAQRGLLAPPAEQRDAVLAATLLLPLPPRQRSSPAAELPRAL